MSSRGEPKIALGSAVSDAAPPEVSIKLTWSSSQNGGFDMFAAGSRPTSAIGSLVSSFNSSPIASVHSLGSPLSAASRVDLGTAPQVHVQAPAACLGTHANRGGQGLLDALTERISELEARHKRDAREIELLRAEVDSKNLEIAAKEADIKLKDMELAEAERTVGSKGLLIESLQAELEETKANLEHAQLETMTLENGLDFVKAVQVYVRALAHMHKLHTLTSTCLFMCICRNPAEHPVQYPAPSLMALYTTGLTQSRSPRTRACRLGGRKSQTLWRCGGAITRLLRSPRRRLRL
jgi:hypothetical protein